MEVIGLASAVYDELIARRIAQTGFIELPFKSYQSFIDSHTGATKFSVSCQSLDRIWVVQRTAGWVRHTRRCSRCRWPQGGWGFHVHDQSRRHLYGRCGHTGHWKANVRSWWHPGYEFRKVHWEVLQFHFEFWRNAPHISDAAQRLIFASVPDYIRGDVCHVNEQRRSILFARHDFVAI